SGDVRVLTEMAVELSHERLAEPHDLHVGAALWIEIRSTLGAADRHAGQSVLERLLEGEKLHYPEVDARVESQTTLVRAERGVEADAKATVDLHLPFVIDPGHAEDDLTLGLADALDQRLLGVIRMLGDDPAYAVEDLSDGLVKF